MTRNKVIDSWTEREEGVYTGWAVLVETDFMEIWVCRKSTETMGCLAVIRIAKTSKRGYLGESMELWNIKTEQNVE